MTQMPMTIDDRQLGDAIRRLKGGQEYRPLVDYLITAIASGGMSSELQAKAYNELGLAHLQLDQPEEAEKAFRSAIDRAPERVNPRFNLANLFLYAQQYELALSQYQEILDMDISHVGAKYHAGLCYAMTDRPDNALSYFEDSAAAAPDAMGPNFWAGETLLASKKFDRALPYFQRAVEITPDHRESCRGIAICLFEQEKYEECIEQCNLLIASGSGAEFLALQIKGDALIELEETEQAALSHLELASLDFDARDYLVMRSKNLAEQHPDQVGEYIEVIQNSIPELDRAFVDISCESNREVAQ